MLFNYGRTGKCYAYIIPHPKINVLWFSILQIADTAQMRAYGCISGHIDQLWWKRFILLTLRFIEKWTGDSTRN